MPRRESHQPSLELAVVAMLTLVLPSLPAGAWSSADRVVTIRGSSTVSPLAELWAAAYRETSPEISIDLADSGTSEGIEALLAGQADIAMASRPMTAEEKSLARERGLDIRSTVVARLGIAVVVHQENAVESLSTDQIAAVFSGDLRNWKEVGGEDVAIEVVRKESGWSPDFFRRRIMGERPFRSDSRIVESKADIVTRVAAVPGAIGVTGMPEAVPELGAIKLLRITTDDDDATYALSRPLFFFSLENASSLEPFLRFVTGPTGQGTIVDTGFFPAGQRDVTED